jgi:hypothetical protein
MTVARHRRIKFSPHMLALAVAFTATLTGCMYEGGIGEPVARKFTWFSYIAGDDIKARCTPGSPAHYRFVYNANWSEQVRAYDLRRSVIVGGGATLWTQVFGGNAALNAVIISDPQGPWRGQGAQTRLSEEQYLTLIRAVEASGFGQPSPEGLRLDSWDFYWVVTACANGRFHMNAWRHPSDRFAAITFDRVLFPLDTAGVPVNPPRRIEPALERTKADREGGYYFQLMVGQNGFAGRLPPL